MTDRLLVESLRLHALAWAGDANLGDAARDCAEAADQIERLKRDGKTMRAMIRWLKENQPDVFRRGIWDAINEVST